MNLVQFIDGKVAPAQESADKAKETSDKKIFINELSAESLSIQHIAAEDYYKLVANSPEQLLSNKMYIVSSDFVNAYGRRVQNVAEPEEESDAATKKYADAISSQMVQRVDSNKYYPLVTA